MFLLDTAIVVDLRDSRGARGDPALVAWANGVPHQRMFLSAASLVDLERAASDAARAGRDLGAAWRGWIDGQLLPAFAGRILPIDAAVAQRRGQLPYADLHDGLLAATAIEHNLTLATSRTAAFKAGKVRLLDPRVHADAPEPEDWREAARAGSAWLKTFFVRA